MAPLTWTPYRVTSICKLTITEFGNVFTLMSAVTVKKSFGLQKAMSQQPQPDYKKPSRPLLSPKAYERREHPGKKIARDLSISLVSDERRDSEPGNYGGVAIRQALLFSAQRMDTGRTSYATVQRTISISRIKLKQCLVLHPCEVTLSQLQVVHLLTMRHSKHQYTHFSIPVAWSNSPMAGESSDDFTGSLLERPDV